MGIPKQSCRRNKWEKIILNNAISESKRHLGVPFYFKIFYLLSFNVLIKLQAKKYGAMGSKRLVGTITDFLPIWSASNTIRTHCAVLICQQYYIGSALLFTLPIGVTGILSILTIILGII